jgi:hypothetical protein
MMTPCAHGALTAPSYTSLHTWVGFEFTATYQLCLHINFSTSTAAAAVVADCYRMLLLAAAAAAAAD